MSAGREPFILDGVAIVTGASSGIGAHFARLLASRGMVVVAAARRADLLETLAKERENILPFACDVTDDEKLAGLVDFAVSHGALKLLVNNAGGTDAPARALDEDPSRFRRVVNLNLISVFVLSSLAARAMAAEGEGGSIVNISSIHGLVASAPNTQAAYVASKAGVIGLTKELAGQWARYRIRVNAIAPGYVHTELTDEMLETATGRSYVERNTVLRRPALLSELDGPLLLLASDGGSYLTGATIAVDGGWTSR